MFSSSFDQYLGTNYEPTDADVAQLQTLVSNAMPELLRMDGQIDETYRMLKEIEAKRDAYAVMVNAHRALLSPIRRVPDDILHTIFMACLPCDHDSVMSAAHAPILLTRICRRWRDLALNTPLLWSSIHIPIPRFPDISTGAPWDEYYFDGQELQEHNHERNTNRIAQWGIKLEGRTQLISSWLTRAKNSNLSITLHQWDAWRDTIPEASGSIPDGTRVIVNLIRSYASQWERLEVMAVHTAASILLSLSASEVPRLRHLTVACSTAFKQPTWPPHNFQHIPMVGQWMVGPAGTLGGLGAPQQIPPPPPPAPLPSTAPILKIDSIFSPGSVITSPNVRSLSLRITPEDVLATPAHWENLTTLSFGKYAASHSNTEPLSFDCQAAATILRRCSNLERCSLVIGDVFHSHWPPPEVTTTDHIRLSHLHLLDIYECTGYPLTEFAKTLELPALRSIRVATVIPPRNTAGSTLVTFLRGWGHNVRSLEFDYQHLTNEQVLECLQLVPKVKELVMSFKGGASGRNLYPSMSIYGGSTVNDETTPRPAIIGDELVSKLTPCVETGSHSGGGYVLCPKLESFLVRVVAGDFSEESLVEFIRARRHNRVGGAGISKIRRIDVWFDSAALNETPLVGYGPYGSPHDRNYASNTSEKENWPPLETLKLDANIDLEGLETDIRRPRHKVVKKAEDETWSAVAGIDNKMFDGPFGFVRRPGFA